MGSQVDFRRGDIVVVVARGSYGKTRPAAVVQNDLFNTSPPSITVCLITTHVISSNPVRVDVPASAVTGLERPSQLQADKTITLPVDAIRGRIGALPVTTLHRLEAALRLWLAL